MHTIVQVTCLIALACFGALWGLVASRFTSRYLHVREYDVQFDGVFGAVITVICCLVIALNVKDPHSILSMLEAGLISQLTALIHPLILVGATIGGRVARFACVLVDGLFSK